MQFTFIIYIDIDIDSRNVMMMVQIVDFIWFRERERTKGVKGEADLL